MKVVNFGNVKWQDIPEQDNPAMNTVETKEGRVKRECLLIFGGNYTGITNGGIVVALNPKMGDITRQGVFWTIESAESFAEAISKGDHNE